jgi:hypothetical protein
VVFESSSLKIIDLFCCSRYLVAQENAVQRLQTAHDRMVDPPQEELSRIEVHVYSSECAMSLPRVLWLKCGPVRSY